MSETSVLSWFQSQDWNDAAQMQNWIHLQKQDSLEMNVTYITVCVPENVAVSPVVWWLSNDLSSPALGSSTADVPGLRILLALCSRAT